VSNALTSAWRRYHSLSPLGRELSTFSLALLFALTLLPLAIWCAGQIFLGDYLRDPGDPGLSRQGGPLALLMDYFRGIVTFSPGHWLVLLGPYCLLWALRIGRHLTKT
jgi:hypothetical protein